MATSNISRTDVINQTAGLSQLQSVLGLTQNVGSSSGRDFSSDTMPIPASTSPLYAPAPNAPFPSQGNCSNHNIETAINIMAGKGNTFKTIQQLQTSIGAAKQPCLFEGAYIFGGSGCADEVFNGICSFHWKMMNIRIAICENYTAINDTAKNFSHYEMMVDKPIEDRSLTPIFPYINKDTTMYDVLLGFKYATERGLEETKKNEGTAMAYALYYMINSSCRFDWMLRSQHWIDSMTTYLMSCLLYNDKLIKQGLIPPAMMVNYITSNQQKQNSVLHRFFHKTMIIRSISLPYHAPESIEATGMVLSKRDLMSRTPLQRGDNVQPMDVGGTATCANNANASSTNDETRKDPPTQTPPSGSQYQAEQGATLMPYYLFNIFNAPILLGMRASSFAMGRCAFAMNPNVCIFKINFQNANNDAQSARVFAMEGPIMYGVSETRSSRQLPYMNKLPRLTNSCVALLAASTNMECQEDRIFAAQTAKYHKYEVQTVNTTNKFRLTEITDAGRYM